MQKKIIFLLFVMTSLFSSMTFCAESEQQFPGRELYREVPTYSLDELYKNLDSIVVIDARSQYEFDTLHIKGAINMPVSDKDFDFKLQAVHAKANKPIVFYCNGVTCHKSYQAVRRAIFLKLDNTYAYDAGIFAWAKAHPEKSVLLGNSPIRHSDIIDKEAFNAHLLSPKEFGNQVVNSSLVLDVRDRFQREGIGFFPGIERRVSLDQGDKIDKNLKLVKNDKRPLLIYDEAGSQVQWLQYRLVQAGVTNYYFMKGGAKAYYEMLDENNKVKKAR